MYGDSFQVVSVLPGDPHIHYITGAGQGQKNNPVFPPAQSLSLRSDIGYFQFFDQQMIYFSSCHPVDVNESVCKCMKNVHDLPDEKTSTSGFHLPLNSGIFARIPMADDFC